MASGTASGTRRATTTRPSSGAPQPLTDQGSTTAFIDAFAGPHADRLQLHETRYNFSSQVMQSGNQMRDVALYTDTRSEMVPASGNRLCVAIVAGQPHAYPEGLATLLWQFFQPLSLP